MVDQKEQKLIKQNQSQSLYASLRSSDKNDGANSYITKPKSQFGKSVQSIGNFDIPEEDQKFETDFKEALMIKDQEESRNIAAGDFIFPVNSESTIKQNIMDQQLFYSRKIGDQIAVETDTCSQQTKSASPISQCFIYV